MKKSVKITILAALVATAMFGYLLLGDGRDRVTRDLLVYIKAIAERDFDTAVAYNGPAQKRLAIAEKRSAEAEARLKEIYGEEKRSFDEAVFAGDAAIQWAEKFFFTVGGEYEVVSTELVPDTDNPSKPLIRTRMNAVVMVRAEYKDQSSSPVLNEGRLKAARFRVKMVYGENIARTLRGDIPLKRWLFQSMTIEHGSIAYWQ